MTLSHLLKRVWDEKPQRALVMGEQRGTDEWGWSVLQVKVPSNAEAVEFVGENTSLYLLGRENWRGRYTPSSDNSVYLPPIKIEYTSSTKCMFPRYLLTEKGSFYGLQRGDEELDLEVYHKALEFLRAHNYNDA